MSTLKNNIDELTNDSEVIVKNYLKLFGLKQSERLAIFLGVLSTVFVISLLLLIVIVFCSFVLAGYLNQVFNNEHVGYFSVAGIYILVVVILIVYMKKTGRPLFANLYIKLILPLLNIETNQNKNLDGLIIESENIKEKIKRDKKIIVVHTQSLRYKIFEDLIKEMFKFFTSKTNSKVKNEI